MLDCMLNKREVSTLEHNIDGIPQLINMCHFHCACWHASHSYGDAFMGKLVWNILCCFCAFFLHGKLGFSIPDLGLPRREGFMTRHFWNPFHWLYCLINLYLLELLVLLISIAAAICQFCHLCILALARRSIHILPTVMHEKRPS